MSSHNNRDKEGKKHEPEVVFSAGPAETGGEPADPAAVGAARQEGGPVASFDEQIQKLLLEKQELMDTLVRRQADFENFRKRVEKERHQERHRGAESLVEHILPVLDAFDRALAGSGDGANAEYRKGFELIRKQLWDALAKQGLKRVESVGKEFNPHFHHAIETVETSEQPDGVVIDELQPGYLFHERVLRPAMVRVASAPEGRSAHAVRRDN
ncbi:MAG TPA: nucleotide exchange factor GrpE [Candidatus Baltobacteraceae bacterium]|nr:nucleotide exchange factor GrpE [Candidatus Baltobacteraceae bacterium]